MCLVSATAHLQEGHPPSRPRSVGQNRWAVAQPYQYLEWLSPGTGDY
nr:MAG TPA: hypothetical protein [Caudoviricetes sp.]